MKLTLLIAIYLLASSTGAATRAQEKEPRREPVQKDSLIKINAITLWTEFKDKPEIAEKKYQDKTLEITGAVAKIDIKKEEVTIGLAVLKNRPASPSDYAKLTPQEKKWSDEGYPPNVTIKLSEANRGQAEKLKKEDNVTIQARLIGREDAEVWQGFTVNFSSGMVVSKLRE